MEYGGKLPGVDVTLINRMGTKVEFLQRYMDLYRQGKPIPINRAILEESGVISSRFIDALTDKLNELNANPQALLQALRNREVNVFRSASIDELEQFFIEEGYINNENIICHEDILLRMSAFLTNTALDTEEGEQFINRVLNTTIFK